MKMLLKKMEKKAKLHHFFLHTKASMWIPMRFLISVAIISFFTVLVVIGSQIGNETIQQNDFQKQISKIKQTMETLFWHGESRNLLDSNSMTGSSRVFTISIPQTISSVYFGRKTNEPLEMMSCIRYESSKGSSVIWLDSDITIIAGIKSEYNWYPNENQIGLTLSSGTYKLKAELVSTNSEQFILIYGI